MNNWELRATWTYHDGTKHSLDNLYSDPHYMDFENQPLPFKVYSDLQPIPLPQALPPSNVSALAAISSRRTATDEERVLDLTDLASILYHSAGITRRKTHPGGQILFRAAACTGALYHIEMYLVCGDLPGLDAGVYHFGAHDFALRRLRKGDYREILVRASGHETSMERAPAVMVSTGTYWRNAWKYRARTYRHCFWDNGTILANLLAMCSARRIPARIVAGFVDESVNRLLDLDVQREVALSLVPLGGASGAGPAGPAPEAPPLTLKTEPLSRTEIDYPAIRAMHQASSLTTESEAEAWQGPTPTAARSQPSDSLFPLSPQHDDEQPGEPIERVILRRGSTRQFTHDSISFPQLSTILRRATAGVPADFLEPDGVSLNDLYLIVHAVDGLPQGAYVFHRDINALELLAKVDSRRVAGYLGLQQAIPADASANLFFLTDLKRVLERYGNRGYRAAQLEAAILGGNMYLAAYAQHLGASGLTFFDDDVTTFFSPHAEGKSVMFLVALGVPLRRRVTRRPSAADSA